MARSRQLKRGRPKAEVDEDAAGKRRVWSTYFLPRTAAPANADPGPAAAAASEAAEAADANADPGPADENVADPGPTAGAVEEASPSTLFSRQDPYLSEQHSSSDDDSDTDDDEEEEEEDEYIYDSDTGTTCARSRRQSDAGTSDEEEEDMYDLLERLAGEDEERRNIEKRRLREYVYDERKKSFAKEAPSLTSEQYPTMGQYPIASQSSKGNDESTGGDDEEDDQDNKEDDQDDKEDDQDDEELDQYIKELVKGGNQPQSNNSARNKNVAAFSPEQKKQVWFVLHVGLS